MAQRFVASVYLFIDGTVAGNPADLTIPQYVDSNVSNNHTFYGNGCPDADGSISPCSTRIIHDGNDEPQKNGTYYNNQAATSGAGGTITSDNTNSPDTFCPLGWQLPYSGTGGNYYDKSRSWNYLFTIYTIGFNDGTTTDATKIISYPFSYVYSGRYDWSAGRLYNQSNYGPHWSLTIADDTSAYLLGISASLTQPNRSRNKTGGFPLRCVTRY